MKSDIVITGMGVINSVGSNIESFEIALRKGYSGVSYNEPVSDLPMSLGVAAKIDFNFKDELKKWRGILEQISVKAEKNLKRASRIIQIASIAAMEAWYNSKLNENPIASNKIGLVVAGTNLSQCLMFSQIQKYLVAPEYISPSYALQFMDTDFVGNLSELFEIQGEGFTVGGASASGNVAIIKAYQLLMCSEMDACMVIAPVTEFSYVELMAFENLGVLGGNSFISNPERACRPFDKKHEGFIPGEGCGCIILEKKKSAKKRDANIYAEMLGGAIQLDGNRLSNPSLMGEINVMRKVIDMAGLQIHDIQYINAHATSTPMGDDIEIKAIKKVFGDEIKNVWINSTKSITGHCLYSAGIIELIASVIEMNGNFLHANLNLFDPIDKEVRLVGPNIENINFSYGMSNGFGFGGINTSVIIKKSI